MGDIEKLKEEMIKFRDERDWKKYHNPKDLAISIILEAGELLEIFQWVSEKDLKDVVEKRKKDIENEMADIFLYLLSLCDVLDVDLKEITLRKLEENRKKYPADKVKGKAVKYDEI